MVIVVRAAVVFVCFVLAPGRSPAHLLCRSGCLGVLSEEVATTSPAVLSAADKAPFSRWSG